MGLAAIDSDKLCRSGPLIGDTDF